jgi:hypothetical protein
MNFKNALISLLGGVKKDFSKTKITEAILLSRVSITTGFAPKREVV